VDPRVRHEVAYPLALEHAEVHEHRVLDIRGSFAQAIEKEFGIAVAARRIRLWAPSRAIGIAEVVPPEGVERILEAATVIPYGRTLAASAKLHEDDVHVLVTITPDPVVQIAEPGPAELAVPEVPAVDTGCWVINPGRKADTVGEGERHATEVATPACRGGLAGIVLGMSLLYFDSSRGAFSARASADNIRQKSMRLHLDSRDASRLFHADVAWLRHGLHPALQSGSVDAVNAGGAHLSEVWHRVKFEDQYAAPPRVLVVLSGLTVGEGAHWDVCAFATDVCARAFTVRMGRTRGGAPLGATQVHWFAFPEGGLPGLPMCAGTRSVGGDGGTGRVLFEPGMFAEPPRVFVAVSQFRARRVAGAYFSLRVEVRDVTADGMEWALPRWDATVLESATMVYLAFQ